MYIVQCSQRRYLRIYFSASEFTLKYTAIPQSGTPTLGQRYQDSTQDPAIFYTYDGSAGITDPPPNTIDNNIQIVPGVFNCPTLLPVYNFYNAILCNNVDSIIVRSPEGTTFVAGQVVKVIGSTLCYEMVINSLLLTS